MVGQHSRGIARLPARAWDIVVRTLLEDGEYLGKCLVHALTWRGSVRPASGIPVGTGNTIKKIVIVYIYLSPPKILILRTTANRYANETSAIRKKLVSDRM